MIAMDECVLNDLLECSVCLEQLDSTSKVLPCQHTFCKRCLEEIVSSRKELRCPECRVLVETKVEELPCNILLIRILEGMKNAPRMKTELAQPSIQQLQTSQPPCMVLRHGITEKPAPTPPKQPASQLLLPSGRALYSYEGKESEDLSFKKGDIITLHKKIDQNWYHGELCGKFGFIPTSYIQVITPLPTHLCKALYDFRISSPDEKDCLTFSKGDVITVIRRVDENWAEGKLGERVGIFPISFVEMSSTARALMKLSTNIQSGPSRVAPPTPSSDSDTTPLIVSVSSGNRMVSHPSISLLSSSSSSTSSSSSSTSTSTSSSSSSSTSSPSSPPAASLAVVPNPPPLPAHQQDIRPTQQMLIHHPQREKRHSFAAVPHSQAAPPLPFSNRHSAEISGSPRGQTPASGGQVAMSYVPLIPVPVGHQRHKPNPQVALDNVHGTFLISTSQETSATSSTPNLSSTSANPPLSCISVPSFYVALYPYKPQKEDELELRKGELYTVSEKCQDGWFKGTSLRTGHGGVFPGNYVQAAKSSLLQAHFRQTSSSLASVRPISSHTGSLPLTSPSRRQSQSHVSGGSHCHPNENGMSRARAAAAAVSECTQGLLDWARSVTALAVPPKPTGSHLQRLRSHTSPSQSGQRSSAVPELPPRSHATESSSGPPTPQSGISQSWHGTPSASQHSHPSSSPLSRSMLSAASAITPPNVSVTGPLPSSGSPSTSSSGQIHRSGKNGKINKKHSKVPDKVSFVKMLTAKKKLKVTASSTYSMDNPVFVDCQPSSSSTSAPVTPPQANHVRSESCPSDVIFPISAPHSGHKKSNSIDGSTSDGTSANNGKMARPKQPTPLVRERFKCIVPYPPNSEYELELKVGDVVYVHKKREDGWYKGTLHRTGKTGLFPGSFVERF